MTLSVYHVQLEDGTWIATCDMFPAWSFKSDDIDHARAQKSLKRYVSTHMQFSHHGWNGRT